LAGRAAYPVGSQCAHHSDAQIAEISGSIKAFGFSNPILVGALLQMETLRR
jgi:ParB-like chromosome segregation protein Spo0J